MASASLPITLKIGVGRPFGTGDMAQSGFGKGPKSKSTFTEISTQNVCHLHLQEDDPAIPIILVLNARVIAYPPTRSAKLIITSKIDAAQWLGVERSSDGRDTPRSRHYIAILRRDFHRCRPFSTKLHCSKARPDSYDPMEAASGAHPTPLCL